MLKGVCFDVPLIDTASGIADITSHILECYFSNISGGYFQEEFAIAALKTCFKYGRVVVKNPSNYEARANLSWVSCWAINDFLSLGREVGWTLHPIEHQLSAYYDISHGSGLAILMPHWLQYLANSGHLKEISHLGRKVFDFKINGLEMDCQKTIKTIIDFFQYLSLPSKLSELGISEKYFDVMSKDVSKELRNTYIPMDSNKILSLYLESL